MEREREKFNERKRKKTVRTQKKREKCGCSIVAEEAVKYMRAQLKSTAPALVECPRSGMVTLCGYYDRGFGYANTFQD